MQNYSPKALIVSLLLVCTALEADGLAQAKALQPDSLKGELGEVRVVASRRSSENIVPHQRLSGRRLEGLSAHSVADAVRYFSGIQIKDYGGVGGLKTVDMRSMGSHHMGVFYDGIQLGNAQNGQIDLGRFSMDNIEEISLYNGQKSSIFQSAKDYGASGTIYLRSRRPRFAHGQRRNVQATYRTGSFGLQNPSLLWEERITDKVSAQMSAEYTYATGKYRFRYRKVFSDGTVAWDTTATRQNGDLHALRLEGGLYGLTEHGRWQGKVYYYRSERGIPGAIVNNVWKHSQRQWDKSLFAQGSVEHRFGENYELMVNAKVAYDKMRYLNPDTTLMYIDNTFRHKEAYLSVANHYNINKVWDAALSADWQWNSLDADMVNFVYPRRNTVMIAAASTATWPRLKLLGSLLATFVRDSRKLGIQSDESRAKSHTSKLMPALYLNIYPLSDKAFCLRAFYKRIFRMPTFNDLYYTDFGNINLKPEYTTQYDLGAVYQKTFRRGMLRQLEANADAYYNRVSNKIVAVPKGSGQYRWMTMNLGLVKILGTELSAQAQVEPVSDLLMALHLSYTWQLARDYSDPTDRDSYGGTYKGQIAYIPRHSGSATANIDYRSWGLNYSFIYVGERYHNSANIRANHEEPWYTHDLGLTKQFRFRGWGLSLALECNNLFDQQYDVVLNYPMPGRNWKITAKIKI
jgi:outer membrane cobalamin receptor